MKTKYGEINSIMDLFEDTGKEEIGNPSNKDPALRLIMKEVKCRLCGDKFMVQSDKGMCAWHSNGRPQYGQDLREHIELHKTVNLLK